MRIKLLAVGERMPAWVRAGFEDYAARFPREWRFELKEIPAAARSKNADIARLKEAEGEKIIKALPRGAQLIALDERGELLNTLDWAKAIEGWQREGREACLLIGGPDGLAPGILARAQRRWSLSRLTLPHALVRVLVAEQLYRAWSVLANHPYHRA
ncbi:MAG: 23S rRNA (pseudouridine(1915)-N(3))-methyltransferase RlmH [Hydrocarboniphaga effusa]|nr:23S rRNA (pseudouridine(1915)-N(3))-methyltransferase RlmH [Hydrocarboniphaga effusa]